MMDLQRGLISSGDDLNRLVGENVKVTLDSGRYLPKMKMTFAPQRDLDKTKIEEEIKPVEYPEARLTAQRQHADPGFPRHARAGSLHLRVLSQQQGRLGQTELRSYAFNLDAGKESDLRRAAPRAGARSRARDSKAG